MTQHPITRARKQALREAKPKAAGAIVEATPRANAFFSFQYSYTELSSQGGKTRLKSRKASLRDGKLSAESFEGELGRDAYEQVVGEVQRRIAEQALLWLRAWPWLPLPPSRAKDR